jgi:acyl-CoA synthetase (NDP forming)
LTSPADSALARTLEARSVALVGASARPGGLGQRMVDEVLRSPGFEQVWLVNPSYDEVAGRPCLPTLADVDASPDLVLLGVGDTRLVDQLKAAAAIGARGAVVFGSAHADGVREQLREIATGAGMALVGAGCMGFWNVRRGIRAMGYTEREDLAPGPVSVITHSGSVFSTLLRTRLRLGFDLVVSSGQELVTTTPDYVDHIVEHTETKVLALVVETIRGGDRLRWSLRRAREAGIEVVLLPVGHSPLGSAMVAAHSGAVAGGSAAWEALADDIAGHLVGDLAELGDTLGLLVSPRRPPAGRALATVHDSGAERSLVADLAHQLGVPFAPLAEQTLASLALRLDEGLEPGNPLDVWGGGAGTRELFGGCLADLAADPAVGATALAIDLVPEYDGDIAYPDAALDAFATTDKPVVVLSGLSSAIDHAAADRLRLAGVPVLEGFRSGLLALKHLQDSVDRPGPDLPGSGFEAQAFTAFAPQPPNEATPHPPNEAAPPPPNEATPQPPNEAAPHPPNEAAPHPPNEAAPHPPNEAAPHPPNEATPHSPNEAAPQPPNEATPQPPNSSLLRDYDIPTPGEARASTRAATLAAAADLGWPVVLKTAAPGINHRSDVGGVVTGLHDLAAVGAAYDDLADRLGPDVTVHQQVPSGVELSVGIVRDAALGPMVVVAAGGVLVELMADRAVALPPLTKDGAQRMIDRLRLRPLLDGWRGDPAADLDAVCEVIVAVSRLAHERGDEIAALDLNPVIATPDGAVAVDVLIVPRTKETP